MAESKEVVARREELLARKQELAAEELRIRNELEELDRAERNEGLNTIHALIAKFKFTEPEVFGGKPTAGKVKTRGKVPAKYRDPETGSEWTGRGVAPRWLDGKVKEQFLIVATAATNEPAPSGASS